MKHEKSNADKMIDELERDNTYFKRAIKEIEEGTFKGKYKHATKEEEIARIKNTVLCNESSIRQLLEHMLRKMFWKDIEAIANLLNKTEEE